MPRMFDVPSRGEEREKALASFRNGLRQLLIGRVDPALGRPVTEADIVRATQEGSRWWAEFDATELVALGIYARAQALADQAFPSRATTGTLRGLHAPQRDVTPLDAAGATVGVEAPADPGAVFHGSTTIGDPTAAFATTAAGLKFQLLSDITTPANGIAGSDAGAPMQLVGVDTGERTNLAIGTKLKWGGNIPLSAAGKEIEVTVTGSGGTDAETDAELADRIDADIRHRPESGNNAHKRRWAREATAAVEDAFIYASAKYAGTDVIAVTQKRGRQRRDAPKGPLARIPSAGTLAMVRAYVVPPASPVAPERITTYVTAPTGDYVNLSIGLAIPRGRGLGWADVRPWPTFGTAAATITTVTDQTHITITTDGDELPFGTTLPRIMVWARSISRWEELLVSAIVDGGGGTWDVTLTSAPSHTLATGDRISPLLRTADGPFLYASAIERYFDALGPGEVVPLESDPRAPRAQRFPDPVERYPQRAGSAILTTLQNAIPGVIATGEVLAISATAPALPVDPALGPRMLVCGHVAVYPSD